MRILIQNVIKATVEIDGRSVSSINRGYLLFIGFTKGDDENIAKKMIDKMLTLRIFPDENGKTNLSLKDVSGEILSVSQFTLYADVSGGRRPAFVKCLEPNRANELWEHTNKLIEQEGVKLSKGVFGADMKVSLTNDGPFTIILDSEELK